MGGTDLSFEQMLEISKEVLLDLPGRTAKNEEILDKLYWEEKDILHTMEMVNLNASEGFRLYKELQRVLQERRKYKDEIEMLKPISMLSKSKYKRSNFDRTIEEVGKVRRDQPLRKYSMRVRTDLQSLFDSRNNTGVVKLVKEREEKHNGQPTEAV